MAAVLPRIALLAVVGSLFVGVPATAQQGFGDPSGDAQTQIDELPPVTATPPNTQSAKAPPSSGGTATPGSQTAASGLARTGSDLEALAAMGAALVLSGTGLRLLTRPRRA
jgi:hypothetical protein